MVGLGETPEEVETLMDDLLAAGCQILTIGQYLQPSHRHYPVAEYVTPQQFAKYKIIGLKKDSISWRVLLLSVPPTMLRNISVSKQNTSTICFIDRTDK